MHKFISQIIKIQKILVPKDLTLDQLVAVQMIKTGRNLRSLTMTDLSVLLNVTTPAVTGKVERLVDAGLVEREVNKEDRRVVLVKVTEKGENLLKEIKTNCKWD